MASVAIIGTGIAGLGCAHFLQRDHDLTLFEARDQAGGQAHTVEAYEEANDASGTRSRLVPIDAGFTVFNKVTYPHLTRLFEQLQVPLKRAPLSFSVRGAASGLEYGSGSLNRVFAQRANLLRPRHWRFRRAIKRFNAEALAALDDPAVQNETLADFVRRRDYGADFFDLYLVPLGSALWHTPPELMLDFPAAMLLRVFHLHGFLGRGTQHEWWTVDGGARVYLDRLTAPFRDRIRLNQAATRVIRTPRGVAVMTASGSAQSFDKVILACPAPHALRLLVNATPAETAALAPFRTHIATATVHTDTAVMPRLRRTWSAWNYELARDKRGELSTATHFWMNRLQGVSDRAYYFVSVGRPDAVAPEKVIRRVEFEHPLFTLAVVRAQAEIPVLNHHAAGTTETYFVGAWQRHGFHEDGLLSAAQLCEQLLGRDPWAERAAPDGAGTESQNA